MYSQVYLKLLLCWVLADHG